MLNQHGGCVPYESIEDDDRTQASQAMNRPFGSVHCLELGTNQALLKPFTLMLGGNLAHTKVPAKILIFEFHCVYQKTAISQPNGRQSRK